MYMYAACIFLICSLLYCAKEVKVCKKRILPPIVNQVSHAEGSFPLFTK